MPRRVGDFDFVVRIADSDFSEINFGIEALCV